MASYYILVNDHKNHKYDLIGPISDDTAITNNIANMQAVLNVNCHSADETSYTPSYIKDNGLYYRLIDTYNQITGKQMKKW